MTDDAGVYAIENLYNGRVYIGATKRSFRYRWTQHLSMLHRGFHDNKGLMRDMRRYGVCAFRMVILQDLPRTCAFRPFEQGWIDYFVGLGLQCYNTTPAVESPIGQRPAASIPREYSYTVQDVMVRTGIGENRIYALLKEHPSIALQSRLRWHFSEASIVALIRSHNVRRLRVWSMERAEWVVPQNAKRKIPYGLDASIA